jgi:two-component system catabolic regulation response regulator CreB/two-component system response regulator ChvI
LPRCGIRILLVDDEKDIAFVLKKGLENYGFKVDAFDRPESALENFRSGSYDLMITDIRMPEMNGFELYKEIRKIDAKVKVCFLTASEMYDEEFKKTVPIESVRLIEKPISISKLLEIVRRELQRGV